jgi:hypothetical protein
VTTLMEGEARAVPRDDATAGEERANATLSWELRVFAVALVGIIPGTQLGCITALFSALSGAAFYGVNAAGALLGMLAGGLLEAGCID